jgi:hypothetical protein
MWCTHTYYVTPALIQSSNIVFHVSHYHFTMGRMMALELMSPFYFTAYLPLTPDIVVSSIVELSLNSKTECVHGVWKRLKLNRNRIGTT